MLLDTFKDIEKTYYVDTNVVNVSTGASIGTKNGKNIMTINKIITFWYPIFFGDGEILEYKGTYIVTLKEVDYTTIGL